MSVSTPAELSTTHKLDGLYTAVDVISITPGASALSKPVRAIRANGAGTVTITSFAGVSRTLNFLAGETRMVGATIR